MLRSFTTLTATFLLSLIASAHAQDKPQPVKITNQKCGAYTVQFKENGFGDPPDQVSLMSGGKTWVSLSDEAVGVDFCRDVTGDGVPDVMLSQFTGGAHCCFTHSLYSLTTPPRRILYVDSAHSESLGVRQLDGGGPLELIGDDWRFAYDYGLSFAESVPLPVVYSFQNGQYIDQSRLFPQFLRSAIVALNKDTVGGEVLANYALLTVIGSKGEANTYMQTLPDPYRSWLQNYSPEIRQQMLSYGMSNWPMQAGINGAHFGIGGSFSGPGQRNYLGVTHEGNTARIRLYTSFGPRLIASAPLLTTPLPPNAADEFGGLLIQPVTTVWRVGSKSDDALIEDTRSGNVKYTAYRLLNSRLTELKNDPLAVAATLLSDLSTVARNVSGQYRKPEKPYTAAQQADLKRRLEGAVNRAQPWLAKTDRDIPLRRLGNFVFDALELPVDQANRAQVRLPVYYGLTAADQKDEFVSGDRYTMIIDLAKQGGQWTLTNWTLEPRGGDLNAE